MRHSFAATNPCHVYDLAQALWKIGGLERYYSGYPSWRLHPPEGFPIRTLTWRTLVTYGMQRLPERMRVDDTRMFRWQDRGFDRAAARVLEGEGFLHGLPGQCLELFRTAKSRGLIPVLNHASGPLEQQRALVAPEYRRAGLELESRQPLPARWRERLQAESDLADYHCAASTVVRDQLEEAGMDPGRIWVVPYGADERTFPKRRQTPGGPFRICFAGRQSLRKGLHYLLKALELAGQKDWELHCFGMPLQETAADLAAYRGAASIRQRGSVAQAELGRAFAEMRVLVLPSAEEAFGLVVVQALQAGLPCIVSNRVGAKDLIREGENGSIVPFGDTDALAEALRFWSGNGITVPDRFPWSECARKLLEVAGASRAPAER